MIIFVSFLFVHLLISEFIPVIKNNEEIKCVPQEDFLPVFYLAIFHSTLNMIF